MKTPPCERHKNLQMVPFFIEYTSGPVSGHVCPVPGCGRHHTENGYFDLADGKPAREDEQPGQAETRDALEQEPAAD